MEIDKTKPTLLIFDGDVLAFTAAAAVQQPLRQANGDWTQIARLEDGVLLLEQIITKLMALFAAKDNPENGFMFVISDPKDNWRYDIDRDYKGNRKEDAAAQKRPMLLGDLKAWLTENKAAMCYPKLEADDLISILMTDPDLSDFTRIAIGRDKDFKSIPGWYYHLPTKLADIPTNAKPVYSDVADADRWHMIQSLAGDMTDNIPGCTNIGVTRAERIVDAMEALRPEEGVITRGKNKGQKTIKWMPFPAANVWDVIVTQYQKAGLTEKHALDTARLTHLLRFGEYNAATGEVVQWMPPTTAE